MKISLIQSDIIWAKPEANVKRMIDAIGSNPGADLYILPEMFSTGFNGECEMEPSATLEAMKGIASEKGCAVAGSIALQLIGGEKVNRFYFVSPDGEFHYDKRHLFTYSGEDKRFTSGKERVIVKWKGVRILLTVCYDLRFPVWSRNRGDYDLMLCVASWPQTRRFAWDSLLRARAIENQCYVAGVNRIGSDPSCRYDGGSVLLDPFGKVIASCADSKEQVAEGEIKIDYLEECRRKFPVLDDADDFKIL
ncbi:MAG: amidohydrolase [Candidatus Cryptobacteroides sp.]